MCMVNPFLELALNFMGFFKIIYLFIYFYLRLFSAAFIPGS